MLDTHRIDLAHVAGFRLGRLDVDPQRRELRRDDGASEVLEPRVMQVLVALAHARGGTLTRDDLTRCCWEGRVVGEDAINRVISRLRRAAAGIGAGSFRIETLTKVGYRLIVEDSASRSSTTSLPVSRRRLIFGGGAAAALAAAGGAVLWQRSPTDRAPPRDVAALVEQASMASRQGTAEGNSQAIGLLRRVVEIRPNYADGWGQLALAYFGAAQGRSQQDALPLQARGIAAGRRALELDPDNGYGRAVSVLRLSRRGHAWEIEQGLRAALADHPRNDTLMAIIAALLMSNGRCRDAAAMLDRAAAVSSPSPAFIYTHVQMLWAAGRLEDADRKMDEAFQLYPTHFAVWFTRFYLLLYTGRAAEALAQAVNRDGRPAAIPEDNFVTLIAVARAMQSKAAADIDAALASAVAAAHHGAGHAENAIQFAAALGRVDTAYEVADAYYFQRGFDPGEMRFSPEQRSFTRRDRRHTYLLFLPSTASMRRDPRFLPLAEKLGITRYWQESGVQPDYRRAG